MPNRHAGTCYRCGCSVVEGDGVFEKVGRPQRRKWPGRPLPKWLIQHHSCAQKYRGTSVHYQYQPMSGRDVDD